MYLKLVACELLNLHHVIAALSQRHALAFGDAAFVVNKQIQACNVTCFYRITVNLLFAKFLDCRLTINIEYQLWLQHRRHRWRSCCIAWSTHAPTHKHSWTFPSRQQYGIFSQQNGYIVNWSTVTQLEWHWLTLTLDDVHEPRLAARCVCTE